MSMSSGSTANYTGFHCFRCHRGIPFGEPYTALSLQVEVAEPSQWITVQSSEDIFVMCVLCTPRRDQIESALERAGLPARSLYDRRD